MKSKAGLVAISLILVILFSPIIVAPPEADYTNPDYVNNLGPQDIVSAINDGKITDISIVQDAKLSAAIRSDASLTKKLSDTDLVRAVNNDASLMEDYPEVFHDIDIRISGNIKLANDNPAVKKAWFAGYGIADEGAQIKSYDGLSVTTSGKYSTAFIACKYSPAERYGARVTEDGKLLLKDGSEIGGGFVTNDMNGLSVDLKGAESADVLLASGTIKNGDTAYSSESGIMMAEVKDGSMSVTGDGVSAEKGGKKLYYFSGTVAFTGDAKMVTGGSYYTDYGIEGSTFGMHPDKDTYLVDSTAKCPDDKTSCVQKTYSYEEHDEGDIEDLALRVYARDNNNLEITSHSKSVDRIEVPQIGDDSKVFFSEDRGVNVLFSKEPYSVKGDVSLLYAEAVSSVNDPNSGIIGYDIKDGKTTTCTGKKSCRSTAEFKSFFDESAVKVVHIAVDAKGGQKASEKGAIENGDVDFVPLDVAEKNRIADESGDAQVVIITGHHAIGGNAILGMGEKGKNRLGFDELPKSDSTEALMFSSCNSVMNPDNEAGKGADLLKEWLTAYPNLNIVVGYDSKAPLHDENIWENILADYPSGQMSSDDYKNLAKDIIDKSTPPLQSIGVTNRGNPNRYKMSSYVKQDDGWYFYSKEHPEGIKVPVK